MAKGVPMSMEKNKLDNKPFRVRRGRVDSVDLYEVKEYELEILENGEPTGIHLNFAILLVSLAFSGILTLCTATFSNQLIENTFLFVSIIGVLGGSYLFVLWWRGRKSIKSIIKKIKDRIPVENIDLIDESSSRNIPMENDESVRPEG